LPRFGTNLRRLESAQSLIAIIRHHPQGSRDDREAKDLIVAGQPLTFCSLPRR
jgi:hypothetical protein